MFVTGTANYGKYDAIYRTCISYTEGEISEIMWKVAFCAHKLFSHTGSQFSQNLQSSIETYQSGKPLMIMR